MRAARERLPLISTLLALVLGAPGPGWATVPGDLSGDGYITLHDTAIALRLAAGLDHASPGGLAAGDLATSSAGRITLEDALAVARIACGLASPPPYGTVALDTSTPVTVAGDTRKDLTLSAGFRISGMILDTLGRPIQRGVVSVGMAEHGYPGSDTLGSYEMDLPPGTYQPEVVTLDQGTDGNGFPYTVITHTPLGQSLSVTGDATHNYTRPDLPARVDVSVTVSAPESFALQILSFDEIDPSTNVVLPYWSSWMVDSRSFTVQIPPDPHPYRRVILGTLRLSDGSLQEYGVWYFSSLETISEGKPATWNLSVPEPVEVYGRLIAPEGAEVTYISFSQDDDWEPVVAYRTDTAYGEYRLAVPPGHYLFAFGLKASNPDYPLMTHLQWQEVPPGGGMRDIVIPALPPLSRLHGTIRRPAGVLRGGPPWSVLVSQGDNDVPPEGCFRSSWLAFTDEAGRFSALLPEGDYILNGK